MAAIAVEGLPRFTGHPLEYSHQLEASGVPRAQAEVHARAMTAMFLHNFDALVTRDYLDSRFDAFELRVESKLDRRLAEFAVGIEQRFVGIDKRFTQLEASIVQRFAAIDRRFTELEADIARRFTELEAGIVGRFAAVDVRFERIEDKFNLVYWMQGMTIACVVIPLIRGFLG